MAFGVAVVGALYRGFLGSNPQAPGPDTGMADFAAAFDLTAYVLAALAVGTALLAVRLGRVPASAEAARGARAEVGQDHIEPAGHGEEPVGAARSAVHREGPAGPDSGR